uniref:FMN-binding negative transcriptional regulator n=1 Tax=Sphingomonas bacterium TaxID=1895847 RepID=UPI0026277FBC|nr:FMN-binding negative transcriptional regulator [Sphingomonas bacterium]
MNIRSGCAGGEPMGRSGRFEGFDPADVRDLIAEFPLAWVCAPCGDTETASLLPLLGEFSDAGELTHLFGHMSRGNPLCERLGKDPEVLILFQGPQAYISPTHAGRRDWAPTWNYAQLRIAARVTFLPDETPLALLSLVSAMEGGLDHPWDVAELGDRYVPMQGAIIAFRAEVTVLSGKFKLGQDEEVETLQNIFETLPDQATVRWMRRFNAKRLA